MRCAPLWLVLTLVLTGCSGDEEGPNGPTGCPDPLVQCGNGCVPANAICCDDGSKTTSSFCTNAAVGPCTANTRDCQAAFPSGQRAAFCCGDSGTTGTNDCPAGQRHCGLLCRPVDTPCCSPGEAGCELTDPCQVAGLWETECAGGVPGCGCTIPHFSDSFEITPEIATWGGSWGNYEFDPATCTLTRSSTYSDPCGSGTNFYARVLEDGASSFSQNYSCWSNDTGACICTGSRGCSDLKL